MSKIYNLKSFLWNYFRKPLLQFRFFRKWFGSTYCFAYYLMSDGFQQASRWVPDYENRINKRIIYVETYFRDKNGNIDFNLGARERLWYLHGCEFGALYHDDGEMQCGNCAIDFKRSDLETINRKLYLLYGNG